MRQHGRMAPAIVEHVLVHLVGEEGNRPVADQRGERIQVIAIGHRAARVLRAIDDDQPGAVAQHPPHMVPIEAKRGRRQRDAHAAAARQPHRGLIGVIGRIEYDGLIPGTHHRLDCIV